jgi:hypothetical protein
MDLIRSLKWRDVNRTRLKAKIRRLVDLLRKYIKEEKKFFAGDEMFTRKKFLGFRSQDEL